jgi:hypothetical protein
MFQSLFSWNLPLDRIYLDGDVFAHRVSILVFMDLALEVSQDGRKLLIGHVSILVFVELALGHVHYGRDTGNVPPGVMR